MDLKVALKRVLAVCVTATILSTGMAFAKGKPVPAPSTDARAALSPERVPASKIAVEKRAAPVARAAIDMAAIKSPGELKAAVKAALTNKAVAARLRAELGNVNYRMLKRALDESKEPAVETQAVSGWACWFACLRSFGVSIYSATICAATCAAGVVPACVLCAAITGAIATICAQMCAHESVGDDGGGKAPILNE